jgi:septal ring factor EnvC (AmiA/AmiB activator)
MAPISSAGSLTIPAAQPPRSQAERPAPAAKIEETAQQEKQLQRASDEQSRVASEQEKATSQNQVSPSVAQADDEKSAGEQQKIEAAQQEAQRAEFDQQAGNVRETEPNDVRPPSNSDTVQVETLQADNPAIDIFVQLQNIDSPPRQGQEVNRFA